MIKFIIATLWIIAATAGAVFYSFQAAGARTDEAAQKPLLGGLDYVNTDIISVPLIRNSQIEGYFLTKLVYTVEPKEMAKLSVPAQSLFTDQIYTYLYSNPPLDLAKKPPIDVEAFRKNLRETVNARIGIELVHEVLIDQFDFLSKDDIRDNAIKRRQVPARNMSSEPDKPAPAH